MYFIRSILPLLLAAGCAQPPYWEPVEGWRLTGEVRVHTVDFHAGAISAGTLGYAERQKDGSCDIFILRKAIDKACVERHERRHCGADNTQGVAHDHPQYAYSMECI